MRARSLGVCLIASSAIGGMPAAAQTTRYTVEQARKVPRPAAITLSVTATCGPAGPECEAELRRDFERTLRVAGFTIRAADAAAIRFSLQARYEDTGVRLVERSSRREVARYVGVSGTLNVYMDDAMVMSGAQQWPRDRGGTDTCAGNLVFTSGLLLSIAGRGFWADDMVEAFFRLHNELPDKYGGWATCGGETSTQLSREFGVTVGNLGVPAVVRILENPKTDIFNARFAARSLGAVASQRALEAVAALRRTQHSAAILDEFCEGLEDHQVRLTPAAFETLARLQQGKSFETSGLACRNIDPPRP
jgi:hypothetical protein